MSFYELDVVGAVLEELSKHPHFAEAFRKTSDDEGGEIVYACGKRVREVMGPEGGDDG